MIDLLILLFILLLPGLIMYAVLGAPIIYTDNLSKDLLKNYELNSYLEVHKE